MIAKCGDYLIVYIGKPDFDVSCKRGFDHMSNLVKHCATKIKNKFLRRLDAVIDAGREEWLLLQKHPSPKGRHREHSEFPRPCQEQIPQSSNRWSLVSWRRIHDTRRFHLTWIQLERAFHRLITLRWPSLISSFAYWWNRYAPIYEVSGFEAPTVGIDLN